MYGLYAKVILGGVSLGERYINASSFSVSNVKYALTPTFS